MNSLKFKKIEKSLPGDPGVYQFFDKEDQVLYVGKAKNLRKRISSYFVNKENLIGKTRVLVSQISRLEYTVVNSEQDALILENSLIKELQPKYNMLLKDDKTYPWVCIKNERFPRVFMTRSKLKDGSEYLGPFTSVKVVRNMLEIIREIYPIRTCNFNLSEKNIQAGKFKLCLEYQIGKCLGPCEGLQSEDSYNQSIEQIRKILKGKTYVVEKSMRDEMKLYADQYEFEKAENIKKQLQHLSKYHSKSVVSNDQLDEVDVFSYEEYKEKIYVNYLKVVHGNIIQNRTVEIKSKMEEDKETQLQFAIIDTRNDLGSEANEIIVPFDVVLPFKNVKITVPNQGDKKRILELSQKNLQYFRISKASIIGQDTEPRSVRILEKLKSDLGMAQLPTHIECFDNSNFQGKFPVASMVVFKYGRPAKRDYRHFNIKTVEGIDDFGSMKEIVYRRYKRLLEENDPLPQLILVDGGKGQLSAAVKSLEELGIQDEVVILGIAKRLEELYRRNDPIPLHLDKRSTSLKLIQNLRNEAHRFAITFHRTKRDKKTLQSELLDIPGVGKTSLELLLKKLKSVKRIKEADEAVLIELLGKSRGSKLYHSLHSDSN